jgi:hypothetical protein
MENEPLMVWSWSTLILVSGMDPLLNRPETAALWLSNKPLAVRSTAILAAESQ